MFAIIVEVILEMFYEFISTLFTVINLRNIQYILLIYIFNVFLCTHSWLYNEYTAKIMCRPNSNCLGTSPIISSLTKSFQLDQHLQCVTISIYIQNEQQCLPSLVLVNHFWMLVSEAVYKETLNMARYASISCYRQLITEVTGRYDILLFFPFSFLQWDWDQSFCPTQIKLQW